MDARLKIIEPDGEIISDVYHKIPFAKSPDGKTYYRNFLFIGDYVYYIRESGELRQINKVNSSISKERMDEIRSLHAEKVKQINKQSL